MELTITENGALYALTPSGEQKISRHAQETSGHRPDSGSPDFNNINGRVYEAQTELGPRHAPLVGNIVNETTVKSETFRKR